MRLRGRLSVTKFVVLVMIVCLLLPQAAFAADETTVPKWKFTDVSNQWFKKHIEKMGLMNITSGYANGSFRPNNSITQEEAVIMTIRMMNVEDELNMTSEVNSSLIVSAGAKKFLDYALTKRIVNIQEEMSAIDNARVKNEWGKTLATREWIAKLIVRAIGKSSEADAAANKSTQFEDEDNISIGYTGYINVAKNLGIVSGDNKGWFNPTKNVTRAEMAVFIGNAEKYAVKQNSHIVNGTVTNYSGYSISIQSATGLITLNISTNAVFYEQDNNAGILPPDITVGNHVSIIQYGNTAYFIEKLKSNANDQFETITGVFEDITQSQSILLTVNGEKKSYPFASNVTITSETGTGLSLSSLVVGSSLELKRKIGSESVEISHIIVKSVPVLKTVIGTIGTIFSASNMVEVKETATGIAKTYEIPSGVELMSGDKKLAGVGDLHPADEVTVDLKDGIVTTFTVTKSSIVTAEGKVDTVDVKGKKIFLLGPDNTLVGYFTDVEVEVMISGLTSAGLSDVQITDEVILELKGDNLVRKIYVKNRKIETKLGLEFYAFEDNSIILKNKDKTFEVFAMSDGVNLNYNGTAVTTLNINSYFTKGKKVDITYSGDRIISMTLATKYIGKVIENNLATKTLKINSDNLGTISFSYISTPAVEIFGKTSSVLADIKKDDSIQIELDSNQDKVVRVRSMQTMIVKVTSKQSYKLTVTAENGSTSDVYGANAVPITHFNKSSANYTDIIEGGYIQATFAGTDVTDVYIPNTLIGKVTSVGVNSLVIDEYGKSSKTINDNNNVKVVKGSSVYASLSFVTANDRIAIVEGKAGTRLITIIQPEKKTFLSYYASGKTVELKRKLLTENNQFPLMDSAYIHKGSQVLDITALKKEDSLDVYFLNGKIVEIEKL